MKSFILICGLLCGCAANVSRAPATAPYDMADYQPPTDLDVSIQTKTESDTATQAENDLREARIYQDSLVKIDAQLKDENLQLQMCAAVYGDPSKQCYDLRKKFCMTDTLCDARGAGHYKTYCSQEQLDSHNPRHLFHPTGL